MRWCWAGCTTARCSACVLEDLSAGERRLFMAEGKGGRQRVVPLARRGSSQKWAPTWSPRNGQGASSARQVFVVLKGARRGRAAVGGRAG